MKRIVTLLLAVGAGALLVALLVVGTASAAPVTVDTFDNGFQQLCIDTPFCPPGADSSYVNASGILGGERDVWITETTGTGGVAMTVDYSDSDELSFTTGDSTLGVGEITWDGDDNSATSLDTIGLGKDLTDGGTNNGFQLLVAFSDGNFDLTVFVYSSTKVASYTLPLASDIARPGQSFFMPFNAFTGASDVFTDAGAIVFRIEPQVYAVDLTLDLFEATAQTDWGDLPESPIANYPTSLANNGPRHVYTGTPAIWLGPAIDLEADGFPSINADGDDNNIADEDGIVLHPSEVWSDGATVHLTATVTGGPGELYSWWDWDNDGSLADETVISWIVASGDNNLALTVIGDFNESTPLYARYRLVPLGAGNPGYTGQVDNGEVEDYRWTFTTNAVVISDLDTRSSYRWMAPAAGAICLAGLGGGLLLLRRKRVL